MKKYLVTRMRLSALIIVGALVTLALVTPHLVEAQSTSEKIRLMADTLRARDSGDLDLAKEKAEALIKVAPNDENIQRLLASINRDLDRRGNRTAPVVYGQASNQVVEVAMDLQSSVNTADAVVAEAAADQDAKIAAAKDAIADARQLAKLGAYSDASNLLNAASASLTLNIATAGTIEAIEAAKAEIVLVEAKALAKSGDAKGAEALVDQYRSAGAGVDSAAASRLSRQLDKQISDPYGLDINAISPEYVAQAKIIRDLLTRGRAQYLNGD